MRRIALTAIDADTTLGAMRQCAVFAQGVIGGARARTAQPRPAHEGAS